MLLTTLLPHRVPVSPGCPINTALPLHERETALINQAQSGDKDAFLALADRYRLRLRAVALRITRSHEQAEDTVQETMLKAYLHLHQYQSRAQFSTWISRIAVNEALTTMRKHRRAALVPFDEMSAADELRALSVTANHHQQDPESMCASLEVRDSLLQAVGSLTPRYRTVFVLTQLKGCTAAEVAEKLHLTVPAVKARVHRARKQLREKLRPFVTLLR